MLDEHARVVGIVVDLQEDREIAADQLGNGGQRHLLQLAGLAAPDPADQPELLGDSGQILERKRLLALAAVVGDLPRIGGHAEEARQKHEASQRGIEPTA